MQFCGESLSLLYLPFFSVLCPFDSPEEISHRFLLLDRSHTLTGAVNGGGGREMILSFHAVVRSVAMGTVMMLTKMFMMV